jgi:hypothetical protein
MNPANSLKNECLTPVAFCCDRAVDWDFSLKPEC